jgi:hypothetical protein
MFLIAGLFHIFIGLLMVPLSVMGLYSAVFGIGYLFVYKDPDKHWLVVLLAVLCKFGVIFLMVKSEPLIVIGEAIWIPFFLGSLRATYRKYLDTLRMEALPLDESLKSFKVGESSLYDLSFREPLLLIFLRHAGCSFCRETLAALSRKKIDDMTTVVVHMGRDKDGSYLREKFKLPWVSFVSDPERSLYRSFGLRRGTFLQLFGPKVLLRGFNAAVIKRLGVGVIQGDGFQMPGAFVVHKGQVIYEERAVSASDQPNFEKILCAQPANEA